MLQVAVLLAIADFRVSEVLPRQDTDGRVRYVELHVPLETGGNCLFPTTRIEIFDGAGELVGAVAPFVGTVCYPAGSFFVLATDEAVAAFGITRDARLDVPIPPSGGQVCLASSSTRYDCARWGAITQAVRFLRNTDDDSSAPAIPDGVALARVADTGVVAEDFVLKEPTPGRPNDGSIVTPPDAGPESPDAAEAPDAGEPDARSFTRPDAAPPAPRPDAGNLDPDFLSADPGGGVLCTCQVSPRPRPIPWLLVLAALVGLGVRRWRA